MSGLRKLADRLIGLSAIVGALALLVEVAVILVDVVGRALGSPLYGSQDIITMTMSILVFGPMALCDRKGGHLAVDLFERHYPPLMNRVIDSAAALIGAIIFSTLAWATYESAKLSVLLNLSTNLLELPKVWFQYALCIFCLITAFGMVLRAVELVVGRPDVRRSGEEA